MATPNDFQQLLDRDLKDRVSWVKNTDESGIAKRFILQTGNPKLRYLPAGSLLFHLIQLLQGPSLEPEEAPMTSTRHHRDPP